MKALVITIPRDLWPAAMENHFHIVDRAISRHVIGAVMANYKESLVTEYEWDTVPPTCGECGRQIGAHTKA